MLQYYGLATRRWASAQLMVMLLDPIVQNLQNYLLFNLLYSEDCCLSRPLRRAVYSFVFFYLFGCLISVILGAARFISCLNDNGLGRANL